MAPSAQAGRHLRQRQRARAPELWRVGAGVALAAAVREINFYAYATIHKHTPVF